MKINFITQTWATGRNGILNMSGLDIQETHNGRVILVPITSKGKIGRCDMCIPKESLDEVISALQKIKNNS